MVSGNTHRRCGTRPSLRTLALVNRLPRKSQNLPSFSNSQRGHASGMEGKPNTEENKVSNRYTSSLKNLDS